MFIYLFIFNNPVQVERCESLKRDSNTTSGVRGLIPSVDERDKSAHGVARSNERQNSAYAGTTSVSMSLGFS